MKVRAKSAGYYNHRRIKEGDVFELKEQTGLIIKKDGTKEKKTWKVDELFSSKWMEKYEDDDAQVVKRKPAKKEVEQNFDDEVI
jgi:hypothetical protein